MLIIMKNLFMSSIYSSVVTEQSFRLINLHKLFQSLNYIHKFVRLVFISIPASGTAA